MGVVEWESGQPSPLRSEPIMWSNNIRTLVALCNNLTPLSRDKVTGPEDEVKMFKRIEAAFVVRFVYMTASGPPWTTWCNVVIVYWMLSPCNVAFSRKCFSSGMRNIFQQPSRAMFPGGVEFCMRQTRG